MICHYYQLFFTIVLVYAHDDIDLHSAQRPSTPPASRGSTIPLSAFPPHLRFASLRSLRLLLLLGFPALSAADAEITAHHRVLRRSLNNK